MQVKQYAAAAAFALWERWLGRTKVFVANSSIDLVADAIKAGIRILRSRF